jgi:acetyl-CoA carboxylase carboxyl transferase subunit alpha
MKITSEDLKELDLIDDVIDEPLVGGHRDKLAAAEALGRYFLTTLENLDKMSEEQRLQARYDRLMTFGAFEERV